MDSDVKDQYIEDGDSLEEIKDEFEEDSEDDDSEFFEQHQPKRKEKQNGKGLYNDVTIDIYRGKRKRTGSKKEEASTIIGEANALYSDGKFDEALAKLKQALETKDTAWSAYLTMAVIYEEKKDWVQAVKCYMEAIAAGSKSGVENSVHAARLAFVHMQDPEKLAYQIFSEYLKKHPKHIRTLYNRAYCSYKLHDYSKAASDLKTIIELNPGRLVAVKMLAQVYFKNGELKESTEVLKFAFSFMNSLTEARGGLFSKKNQGAGNDNKNPYLAFTLLNMYTDRLIDEKEWETVISVFNFADAKRGVSRLPFQLTLKNVIALCRLGRKEDAIPALMHLKRDPPLKFLYLIHDVIKCLMEIREWRHALEILQRLESHRPSQNPFTWTLIAKCYQELGNDIKAVEYYQTSFDHDRRNESIALSLSTLLGKVDSQRAIEVLEQYKKATKDEHYRGAASLTKNNTQMDTSNADFTDDSFVELESLRPDRPMTEPYLDLNGATPTLTFEFEYPKPDTSAQEAPTAAPRMTSVDKTKQYEVAMLQARHLLNQKRYQEFVNTLTPLLEDPELLFCRKRRRQRTPLNPVLADKTLDDAAIHPTSPGEVFKRKVAKKTGDLHPHAAAKRANQNQDQQEATQQLLQALDVVEDLEMEDDHENIHPSNPQLHVSRKTARRRSECVSLVPLTAVEVADKRTHIPSVYNDADKLHHNWVAADPETLSRLRNSKNIWELCGMQAFIQTFIAYMQSILWLNLVDLHLFRVVYTVHTLIRNELDAEARTPQEVSMVNYTLARVAHAAGIDHLATQLMKSICALNPENLTAWNFLFKCISSVGNIYNSKSYTSRLIDKNPNCLPPRLLHAHIYSMTGTHSMALTAYLKAYLKDNLTASIKLCIGVSYLCRAMSRSSPNRHSCIVKGFAFIYRYYSQHLYGKDGSPHEATYNLARAFHHISLYQYAIPLYEQVLLDDPATKIDRNKSTDSSMVGHLKREAAYNLALIYRAAGVPHLARRLLMEHLTF